VTMIEKYRSNAYQPLIQYNKHSELTGQFNHFTNQQVIRPNNRSGGSHANDVLQLTWNDTASYSFSLADLAIDNDLNQTANKLILTIANQSAENTVDVHVKIENDEGVITNESIELSQSINIKQTRFG